MKPLSYIIPIFLVLLTCATATFSQDRLRLPGIKGSDDRVTVKPDKFPWTAIGRLNRRTGGFCTASVIGPGLILTAAHCLWNPRTQRYLPPQSLHFAAGWAKGDYLFHTKAAEVHPSTAFKPGIKSLANAAHDWALIKLKADPVPVTGVLVIAKTAPPSDTPLTQAGYSQDRAQVLTVHRNCTGQIAGQNSSFLIHNCDAVRGDSGSPIFMERNGTPSLVALHVATAGQGQTKGIAVLASAWRKSIRP